MTQLPESEYVIVRTSPKTFRYTVVKPIPDTLRFYGIDPRGNVYRQVGIVYGLPHREREDLRVLEAMPLQRSHNGYLQVKLSMRFGSDSPRKWFKVGATVLRVWLAPPPDDGQRWHCAHEDGNQSNNVLDNLSWKLQPDNEADKKRHGTRVGSRPGRKRLTAKKRQAIIAAVEAAPDGTDSYTKIGKRFHVHRSTVARVMEKYDDATQRTESLERYAKATTL